MKTKEINEFRAESNRKFLTMALFIEHKYEDFEPIFTLEDRDVTIGDKTYISLHRLYLEKEDLTEYEFAQAYLDSWEHWQVFCKAKWFAPYLERMRTHLELKLRARAMTTIIQNAVNGKNAYEACKYIVAKGWIDKDTEPSRRGRPSKAEIDKLAREQVFQDQQVLEDLKRLNIH